MCSYCLYIMTRCPSGCIETHSSLSMAFFSPFSSRSWSRELWCQPSGVNSISLAFSSTRRLNRDSAGMMESGYTYSG